ncbi:hypothetical protein HDZ31DRAFT_31838 [Schizophyllum fasciatum]
MAAVNMSVMPANMPLDFMPVHSRSNSFSSASSHSASRPQSSQGTYGHMSGMPANEEMYRAGYHMPIDHNPMHGPLQPHRRPSHMRARAAASPYPRDTDSVHSSSSETEDIGMYLGPQQPDYHPMYAAGPHMHLGQSQETMHTTSAMGRMSIAAHAVSNDQALEKLAANVRAATTTSASDRAKQIFVQAWLTANYAPYPDGNVPRQGLYFSYRRVCDQYGIPHINTATLGKAIRLCFPTIKTRRLGVRGNSKYHYCGIRPATSTEAEFLQDYIHKSNNNAGQQSVNAARLAVQEQEGGSGRADGSDEEEEDESDGAASGLGSKRNSLHLPTDKAATFTRDLADKTPTANTALSQAQAQRPNFSASQASIRRHPGSEAQSLAFASTSAAAVPPPPSGPLPYAVPPPTLSVRQFPNFPQIEEAVGANSTSPHGIAAREVWGWFLEHLDAILDSVRHFRFDQFEMTLRNFWMNLTGNHREVVHAPAIAGLMAKADAIVYDEILEILRSQMLTPIPSQALANLRQLAIKMEKILVAALDSYGNTFVEPKVELGARFGHLILRFLDIYQVIQALNTVLTNPKQLGEMRRSWQKVDFDSVRNQSALVCNCRHEDLVQLLEVDFVALMDTLAKTPEPVKEVMSWADKCCERLMGGRGAGDERGSMSSRSVLIRWGYVTSQVMRDLTIRSDPAFGAFQILKLFLDDWISVNVLRTVALSTNSVAASVEPVMQQQFFSMSPMAGQESFGAPGMMAHTPTTSSMLAALQNESFPGGPLDAQTGFSADAYASLSYMDTPAPADAGMAPTVEHLNAGEPMPGAAEHAGMHGDHLSTAEHMSDHGLTFAEFGATGGAFDVPGFGAQDLMAHQAAAAATPGSVGSGEDAGSAHSSASPAVAGSPASITPAP